MDSHIDRVLWNQNQISARVSELASQISSDFNSCEDSAPPLFVGVATGAFLFLADLVRKIDLPISVDFIRAQSYGSGTVSNGAPALSLDLKIDVKGRHVVLVEDIVDTGHTLCCLIDHIKSKGASSISVCTFLDKSARRKVQFELVGKGRYYKGFECPDSFVVGYGMDFAERYRNLPYIGVLKPKTVVASAQYAVSSDHDVELPVNSLHMLSGCGYVQAAQIKLTGIRHEDIIETGAGIHVLNLKTKYKS